MRWVHIILLVLYLTFGAMEALADDIVVRPTAQTADWKALATEGGMATVQICLVAEGQDYLDPARHLGCVPVTDIAAPVVGSVTNPMGAGDQRYIAIALSATGAVSEPSDGTLIVQDLPMPPDFVP